MRCYLVFVCAVLLSLQSFVAGGTGTITLSRAAKPEVLASIKGRLADAAGKGMQAVRAAALGTALLLAVGAADSFARGDDFDYADVTASLVGGFAPSGSAYARSGLALDTRLRDGYTHFRFQSALRPYIADTNLTHKGEYIVRMSLRQAMAEDGNLGSSVVVDFGAAQYASNRRQITVLVGAGFHSPNFLTGVLGEGSELQLTPFNIGYLGETWYDEHTSEFDADDVSTLAFGGVLRLHTGGLSFGELTDADTDSLLHHVFAIPKASLSYQFLVHGDNPNSYDGEGIGFIFESTLHFVRWLGVTVEWNKTGTSKAHKRFLAMLSFNPQ